jgi:tetratricopeptide (TPR) repeat protein
MHCKPKSARGRDFATRSRRRGGAELSAPEAAVDAALNHAIEHLKTGRSAAALACMRPLASGNERRPERANLAGLIYLAAGESQSALVWFDRAIALNPGCALAWSNRGTALHEHDRAGALAAFDEALRLGLAEPALYFNRGNLLRAAGRLDEAIAAYDAALRLNPAYPQALRAGAIVLRDLGHRDGALEFLDEAVRLEPFFRDAHMDRGDLLQSLERMEEAIAAYDRALEGEPGHPGALNNRGAALLTLARYAEAGAAFDAAIRADPVAPQAWNNRGNLMMATQRPADAIACYERALALRPDYLEALIGRALAKKLLGCLDEALAGVDAALALDPHSDHARNNKAALLLQRGDFEAGWDLYESRWILSRTAKRALKLPVPEWEGQALERKHHCFRRAGLWRRHSIRPLLPRTRRSRRKSRLLLPQAPAPAFQFAFAAHPPRRRHRARRPFRLSNRALQPAPRAAHPRRCDSGANALSQPRAAARRKMGGAARTGWPESGRLLARQRQS